MGAAIIPMLLWIGFIGMLTGTITEFFASEDEAKVSQQLRELKAQNDKLESELNEIKALLKDKRPLDK